MSNLAQFRAHTGSSISFSDSLSRYELTPLLPNYAQLEMVPNPTSILESPNFLYKPKTFAFSDLIFEYNNSLTGDIDAPLVSVFANKTSTLTSFFASQMVDIPLSFGKSKSLYYASSANPQMRFLNMLSKHGRRLYTARMYALSLHSISTLFQNKLLDDNELWKWRALYTGFVKARYASSRTLFSQPKWALDENQMDLYGQEHDPDYYLTNGAYWVHKLFYESLEDYKPAFSFYIRKVDKMKRKHSRGKSGKYTISWKYVPTYKRIFVVLRWLVKDIRFQKPKTLQHRLTTSLETLLFSRKNHLVYQLRHFVHKFVFQTYRKTLLKTLRSTR